MYLHKIDAKKPIGEFTLCLAYKKIDHHDHMMPTIPVFHDADDRQTVTVFPSNIIEHKRPDLANQDSGNNNQESETQDTQGDQGPTWGITNKSTEDTENTHTGNPNPLPPRHEY
jgi:hypothetical protein